jgi:hypothetical protein
MTKRTHPSAGLAFPKPAIIKFRDAMTYDQRTVDSTGAFLIGELERLDQTLHEPLVDVSWNRDIDLRSDVTIGDEASSFTNSTFAAAGGLGGPNGVAGGKAWISKDANQITGIALDISKTVTPMNLWGMEVKYTLPELESAMKLGRSVDSQKYEGMQLKWNMDVDEQVYIGDSTAGFVGLLNSTAVTPTNVANGASGSPLWTNKTPDEILADVNEILSTTWANSGWALIPTELRLPPIDYGYIVSQKISDAGNSSILKFLMENNLTNQNGRKLNIQPLKWLIGSGASGTLGTSNGNDRMIAYTKDAKRVRFPLTMLQRTPLEYRSLFQITTYYCRLGGVEFPYPETVSYRDGLS